MPEEHQAEFVTAYSVATGEPQRVPAHFFDNPILSAGLSRTPVGEDEVVDPGPSDAWTIEQLEAFAGEKGIDLSPLGAKPKKADLLGHILASPAMGEENPAGES